ncbi:MAG TPA: hypothetical protein VFT08_04505, partial [Pyrinomonadaceae bacterium]|nr:hypothetical protein [Pyrinomonadaceae bacterium]
CVILRALEKAKEDRYQTATDFAADLKTLEIGFSSAERSTVQTEVRAKKKTAATGRGHKIKRFALPVLGVLIIGIVSAWLLFSQKPPPQPVQVRLPIAGNVIEAALSPDGKVVAYVNDENGSQSILLHQRSTGIDHQVVSPANTKYKGLAFFPNGDYLSYLKAEGDSADLYQVSTFGGPSRKLATKVDTPVSFSPDGKQFTFVRYFTEAHSTTLVIADVDGTNERALKTLTEPQLFSRGGFYSSGPAWSPDGKLIAIPAFSVTEDTGREIILINVADGSMTPIKPKRWNIIEKIVWLADGSGFLMNASEGKSSSLQIWLVDRQEEGARNISTDPSNYVGLSATKDSQEVLTIRNEHTSSISIWTGLDSSTPLLSSSYFGDMGITGTADGKFVLTSNIDGNYQIYIMEANGSNRKQLTFNEQRKWEPTVSPDGPYIVYVSVEGRHPHLWRMNIDGTNQTQLTSGGDEDLPRFTPDGKWVVYHSIDRAGYTIRKVSIDGGEPVTLVSDASTQPDVSPDGKMLACFARRPGQKTWEIFVVPIEGGSPIRTFALPRTVDPEWPGLRWMPNSAGLTYVSTKQGVSNVWLQALTGGEAMRLTNFPENRIFFFDWLRNEQELVLVRGIDNRSAVVISNFSSAK